MNNQYEHLLETLKSDPVLELTYEEDLLQNPVRAYEKVCSWLVLDIAPVVVNLKKESILSLRDSIENWEEVERALTGTRHEWMLYD